MSSVVERLPNWITYLRLAVIPLFVALLANDPSRTMVILATILFVFAALTDYVDGYIARRYGAVSDIGKLLDPLADKILVLAALVMLTSLRSDVFGDPWVPGWLVVLVLARDVWVTGLRAVAASQGVIVAASASAKWKSGLQMVAIVLLLLHDLRLPLPWVVVSAQYVGIKLLVISLVLSYWTAIEYTSEILFAVQEPGEFPSGPSGQGAVGRNGQGAAVPHVGGSPADSSETSARPLSGERGGL